MNFDKINFLILNYNNSNKKQTHELRQSNKNRLTQKPTKQQLNKKLSCFFKKNKKYSLTKFRLKSPRDIHKKYNKIKYL